MIVIHSTVVKTSFCRAKCTMFAPSSSAQSICQILFITFSIEEEKINTRRFPSPLPKNCSHFVSCPLLSKASRRGFSRIRNNPQYQSQGDHHNPNTHGKTILILHRLSNISSTFATRSQFSAFGYDHYIRVSPT